MFYGDYFGDPQNAQKMMSSNLLRQSPTEWTAIENAIVTSCLPYLLQHYPGVGKPLVATIAGMSTTYATIRYALPWLLDKLPYVQLELRTSSSA